MRTVSSILFILLLLQNSHAQSAPKLELALPPQTPPPSISFDSQSAPVQVVSGSQEAVASGSKVRVIRQTSIRSGPNDFLYSCGTLTADMWVEILEIPRYGTEYTPIAAPDNCYSLIPSSTIFHDWFKPKDLLTKPQHTKKPAETLIDGEPVDGNYISSGYTLPKGSIVTVLNEKTIKVHGKAVKHCVIRTGGKEKRYVKTTDLEGVTPAAPPVKFSLPDSPLHQPPPQQNTQNMWPGNQPVVSANLVSEQLSPVLAGEVQAADQAYHQGMRTGTWEDARTRYQRLLNADVLSVRILAKNRLEFIRQGQINPAMFTVSHSPQQGSVPYQMSSKEPWIPGAAPAPSRMPAVATAQPAPVKDVTIRSTQPAIPVQQSVPAKQPAYQPIQIPTYQDQSATRQPATQVVKPTAATPAANTPPIQPKQTAQPVNSQRIRQVGKLHRAVQYYGPNQLYYLTNSQGFLTHYVRGTGSISQQLQSYVGKNIEVTGIVIQASIDGQMKPQINVEQVKALQ